MPYKKFKPKNKSVGKITIMIILIFISVVIVGGIYLINSGIIKPIDDTGESLPAGITLDKSELSVYITMTGKLTVSPDTARVSFKSSDEKIATVDENGVITGIKQGEVTITVKSQDGGAASCKVTVLPLPELTSQGKSFDQNKLDALSALLKQHPLSVSVYYKSIQSGAEISYNPQKKYQTGSVIKAPYCKWLISSGASLDEELVMTKSSIVKGSGNIQKEPENTAFSVRQLIDEAIINSDNTAYNMLVQRFGFEGYLSYAKNLGVYANQSKSNIFGNMSAAGAGIFFADIYSYSQSAPDASAQLMEALKNTSYRNLISASVDVPVAHKYGYNNGNNGFHDAGIVYSDSPYVLAIFTTLNPEKDNATEYIQTIAKMIDELN